MGRQKGFLLLESSVSLVIACLAVMLLFITYGQTKNIENKVNRRVDRAYAYHLLSNDIANSVVVHDHNYQKVTGRRIFDQTEKQVYDVK